MNIVYQYLMIALALPTLFAIIWIVKQKGRLADVYNLHMRRARCVKVNFHTASGRNIERFVIPDASGFMRINKGIYKFQKDFAEINERYRIPEIHILENQITPVQADMAMDAGEIEVAVRNNDGTLVVKKETVPSYFLAFNRKVPEQTNKLWAQEVAAFADSHIVMDITTSTAQVLKQLQWTFFLTIAIVIILVFGMFVLNGSLDQITLRLDALVTAAGTRGGSVGG